MPLLAWGTSSSLWKARLEPNVGVEQRQSPSGLPSSFVRGKRLSELTTWGIGGPAKLFVECSKEGFTGLEFACGIPGTVGGAIFMNASANGQETSEVLQSVEILSADGEKIIHVKDSSTPAYGYRRSPYQTMKGFFAIVAATFELSPCPDSRQRHRAFLKRRRQTQPLTELSAGCVFRNPGACFESAGALIEQAGLKGFSVGQAKVSNVHANFLLNAGGASAGDMLALIHAVKDQVYCKFGIQLTEEIIHIPYC